MGRPHDEPESSDTDVLYLGAEIRLGAPVAPDLVAWRDILRLLDEASTPGPLGMYFTVRNERVAGYREFRGLDALIRILKRPGLVRLGLSAAGARTSLPVEQVPDFAEAMFCFMPDQNRNELCAISTSRRLPANGEFLASTLAALVAVFERCIDATGHIHVSNDAAYVRNETTALYSRYSKPRYPGEATDARSEQLKPYRAANDPRVFGAYWGTFLNAEQVEALGGVRQVLATAPVAHTEVLDGGAMYLQLTDTPEPITTPRMRAALPLLEAYLAPISVPVRYFTAS